MNSLFLFAHNFEYIHHDQSHVQCAIVSLTNCEDEGFSASLETHLRRVVVGNERFCTATQTRDQTAIREQNTF